MQSDDWQRENLSGILHRIAWLNDEQNGVIYEYKGTEAWLLVYKEEHQIKLYFAASSTANSKPRLSGIMSSMDLQHPLKLISIYTQAMMLCLAWQSDPQRVCMLGFGGGRIPMILHHYFPTVLIAGVEINPVVVQIAESYFGIQQDPRMKVTIAEARRFLETCPHDRRFDIILIDCFRGAGTHPLHLSTSEFYELCKSHLTEGGVVATNLTRQDPLLDRKIETFKRSFADAYEYADPRACVLFGSSLNATTLPKLSERIQHVCSQYKFSFPLLRRASCLQPLMPT
jgi:spermidine synthase